jgi:hypothetical protein
MKKEKFDYKYLSADFAAKAAKADHDLRNNIQVLPSQNEDINHDCNLARVDIYETLHDQNIKSKSDLLSLLAEVKIKDVPAKARSPDRYLKLRNAMLEGVFGQLAKLSD